LRVGFPHSDIPGSKLVCQLPGAYRRLRRPSSPVIAKASTTCTCSLDPITLSPRIASKLSAKGELVFAASGVLLPRPFCAPRTVLSGHNDTIFTHPDSLIRASKLHPRFATNRDLYFFRIVKERYSRSTRELSVQN
jgi:hypothetical protein